MAFMNLRNSCVNFLKIRLHSSCQRNFSVTPLLLGLNNHYSRWKSYKDKEQHFLEKDKVPQNYQLIYKVPMESYVSWATHVSTITASLVSVAALYQFLSGMPLQAPVDTALIVHSEDIYCFAAGFVAINALLRLVVSVYPLRIYKNQKNYLAVYHSQLPLLTSHHHFEQGQVKDVNYLLSPWNIATYKLGNKTTLLFDDYFKTPSEFHEMQNCGNKEI